MGLPPTETPEDKLRASFLLLSIMIIIILPTICAGYRNDARYVFAQIDPSEDYANRPVCNRNRVELMCYTNPNVIYPDCIWKCNGVIKNQSSGYIRHESIVGHGFSIPVWYGTVEAPELCNCTCTGSLRRSVTPGKKITIGMVTIQVLAHGPPEIKIHNHDNYRAPLEGADLSINATITSDLPFTDYGCPTWIDIPPRWNEIFDCTHSTKPAFVGLEIHNFSYSNDAGNYTITAGNGCGNSFKYILIGMEDDLPLPPPDPSGHGKQPLSREEIIVISCAGFAVVIFILILVIVIFRRKRHVGDVHMGLFSGESRRGYGTMQRNTKKYRRILNSLAPEFASNVNIDNLLPYLQKHNLITNDEAAHIYQTNSLSPVDKNLLLLSCLDEKGMDLERLKLLLCSLNSAEEHLGHKDVAQKLQQLMMDNNFQYDNFCSVCNKIIN